jgi:hypothetical protein
MRGSRFKVQGSRLNEAVSVVVYPNPAKDFLNVEFVMDDTDARTAHCMSMELVTLQGIVVAKQTVPDTRTGLNKTTMDLRNLPNGAYMLKVTVGDKSEIKKVIVNK